jgi:CSLREA domain-containing protein
MRRLFAAFAVAISFVCILTLGLSAQVDLPPTPFDPPPGTVITVTTTFDDLEDNGNCTQREAIQAANTDIAVDGCPAGDGEDLIVLAAGVYTIGIAGYGEDENATGDFDIRSNLVINGAGAEGTILDANQMDRAFHVHQGVEAEAFLAGDWKER